MKVNIVLVKTAVSQSIGKTIGLIGEQSRSYILQDVCVGIKSTKQMTNGEQGLL